jgi:hypothetical protein
MDALCLTAVSSRICNDRLSLRTYDGNGLYTKFVLFRVPVLPGNNLSTANTYYWVLTGILFQASVDSRNTLGLAVDAVQPVVAPQILQCNSFT